MKRVVLVDDLAAVRAVFRAFLAEAADRFSIVGEATTGVEALERITALQPDAVILDYAMPGLSGLDVVAEMRRRGQHTPVILCSSEVDLLTELPPGIVGYLKKPVLRDSFLNLLAAVTYGRLDTHG
jgi:CheY-like chemotaxis protein